MLFKFSSVIFHADNVFISMTQTSHVGASLVFTARANKCHNVASLTEQTLRVFSPSCLN